MPNLPAMQRRAYNALKRWNSGTPTFLVRSGVKRPCVAGIARYSPTERATVTDETVRIYVAAYNLLIPPDPELDQLLFGTDLYNITNKPVGPRPSGLLMYYDCACLLYQGGQT